jgi:hypothetical protein
VHGNRIAREREIEQGEHAMRNESSKRSTSAALKKTSPAADRKQSWRATGQVDAGGEGKRKTGVSTSKRKGTFVL